MDNLGHVLIRADFNVPMSEGIVLDNYRIKKAIENINEIENVCESITYISHLGRPIIEDSKSHKLLSLEPIAIEMSKIIKRKVNFLPDINDLQETKRLLRENEGGDFEINLIENLRFNEGEVTNDNNFAENLSKSFDTYILDAFGASHREHASIVSIGQYLNSYQGPLMTKEINELNKILDNKEDGYTILLGGAKISDKLDLIENLLPKVNHLLIGGGMCFTFLKALNYEVGNSLCEEDFLPKAKQILDSINGSKIILPKDFGVTTTIQNGERFDIKLDNFQKEYVGIDIGATTVTEYEKILNKSKTIFWNGPMGIFEQEKFSYGTKSLTQIISNLDGYTVVGGGDSVAAINKYSVIEKFNHVSTGGGASLAYLEGKELPGVNIYPPLII